MAVKHSELPDRKEGFDSVALVSGSVPQHDLYDPLKAEGDIPQLDLAGSAWIRRFMAAATQHGANIGLVIQVGTIRETLGAARLHQPSRPDQC